MRKSCSKRINAIFIIYFREKGFLKVIATVVQNEHLSYKSGVCGTCILSFYEHARFQFSVQTNAVLLHNKGKETRNK